MMKSCLISILVSLVSLTASWGQAKGTQITETDSTVTLRNSKVRVEFPKGEAFDISKLTLSGKELILGKGYILFRGHSPIKVPKEKIRCFSLLMENMPDGRKEPKTVILPLLSSGT